MTKEGKFLIVDSREPTSMLSMDWSKYKLIKKTAVLDSLIRGKSYGMGKFKILSTFF